MKMTFLAFVGVLSMVCGALQTQSGEKTPSEIEIIRKGSHVAAKGQAQYFTGGVEVDQLFPAKGTSRVSGGVVTFEPGARSAWHTHPLGQTLIVTAGIGEVQAWGGPIQEIREGDILRLPPHVKHWHGATPTTSMTHFAIQEAKDGSAVDWTEQVSDEQNGGRADGPRRPE